MMNVASIDIGSNTVLLLITKIDLPSKTFDTILNRYEIPRLGKGLDKNNNISNERVERLIDILKSYIEIIDRHKCDRILCTATNAMRVAKNAKDISSRVKSELGINIEIISGEREAELSYKGAASILPGVTEKVVLDIGGGSTEIIFGSGSGMKYRKSFPIGAVNLTEKFLKQTPPLPIELDSLISELEKRFTELKDLYEKNIPLIAVAGTPTTLAAISNQLTDYSEKVVEGFQLTENILAGFIEEFSKKKPEEILEKYGEIIRGREDIILAGSLILQHILTITRNEFCTVTGKGIRYGSVVDFIEKLDS
ncbi:MAG: Ppx/GppA phosphatase family protein [Melioribacteraceae bacterium]|nr:Ppx/GppA phosphatase family protein [Melioribacteraceae bacterium]